MSSSFAGGHGVRRRLDVGVDLRPAAQSLGEDRGAGVRHRVGGVLGDALVGVGVAALDDERDAADEGHQRQGGDDDDLAPLPAIRARAGSRTSGSW